MRSQTNDKSEIFEKVRSTARNILGEEHFEHWLKTPKRALANKIPIELSKTKGGSEQVLDLLGRIEHGVFS